MPATLLTGATGQGKTHETIQRIRRTLRRDPFSQIWVLLPTELQISAFRARLRDQVETGAAYFGVEFFNFYELYARILELAGTPQRQIKSAARFRILRHVVQTLDQPLLHFAPIAALPGFLALVASLIEELKRARITPEDFGGIVKTTTDHDLAAIYRQYQEFLRSRDLVDVEGEGWLALAKLAESLEFLRGGKIASTNGDAHRVDLLVVDGYDQFTPVQAQLLALLAERLPETYLTLTYQTERALTAHRRFAQTRKELMRFGQAIWQEKAMTTAPAHVPAVTLAHLAAHLFDTHPTPQPNDGSLTLIEAPDQVREVQTVLRRVKRLLVDGTSPEQIAIVSRNLEAYTAYFLETGAAYGVPLAIRQGMPLQENPAIAAFLILIDLPPNRFARRAVMDTLQSVYFRCPDLTGEQIAVLDRISRQQLVIQDRQHWLAAIEDSKRSRQDEDGEFAASTLEPEEADTLRAGLESFFDRITASPEATAREYIFWLENLIGPDPVPLEEPADEPNTPPDPPHFDMLRRIRSDAAPEIVARDLGAMQTLKHVFAEVLSAYDLVDAYQKVTWETFRLDLQTAIDNARLRTERQGNRFGRVLLASVFEVRGLPHDHLFLIGLAEGEFPARTPENPLYTDEERRRMQQSGIPLLTRAEAADESSLFYEIVSLAQRSLTLTRPYVDEKGNAWPASPYWRAVCQLVQVEAERLPVVGKISLEEAAQTTEAILALAQQLTAQHALTDESAALHNWIVAQPDLLPGWWNTLRGRHIELNRAARGVPHDDHTGYLSDPALRQLVAEQLGPDRLWSASQFHEYARCPYGFFARRLLALEPLDEPQAGMDQLQIGSLYHEILELTYRRLDYEQVAVVPENLQYALDTLDAILDETLPTAPQRYSFRSTALWPYEQESLRQKLYELVQRDFASDSPISKLLLGPRFPYRQEVAFGFDRQPPLVLEGPAGPLKVRGKIDRIDKSGDQVVVIDYKTGTTKIQVQEMIEGRNVQMLLYIAAARQLLPTDQVKVGAFWHIADQKTSEAVSVDHVALVEAAENLHQRILMARQGVFVNVPSKLSAPDRCSPYCEFYRLCRISRGGAEKTIPTTAQDARQGDATE